MTYRIDISPTIEDTRARVKKDHFVSLGFTKIISEVFIVDSYTVDADIAKDHIQLAADALINPLTESATINMPQTDKRFNWAVEIGFLPGVTDTVARTVQETIADRIGVSFKAGENVYTSTVYFLVGDIDQKTIEKLADSLYNPLIQRSRIKSYDQFKKDQGMGTEIPKVELHHNPQTTEVDMDVSDEELTNIGNLGITDKEGLHRGPLALSLPEMKAIQNYFKKLRRNPTDVELETIAQTWSEHCKHTIFNDPLDGIKDGIFKTYIKKATEEIRQKKGKNDFCVSVFTDNAGAIEFDENYLITHKVETHNSPSALDPYGGALTGIVGVNRDALGFGLGAKPIANTYGFCFADPRDTTVLYRDKQKTQKMLSPKRIMEGVIEGVNVGGNSSGIPTPLGFVNFDKRFMGKPLVFVGTVGLIPKKSAGRLSHIKKAQPDDYIVMVGGRVGLDGIHGATFSSESLHVKSSSTAVQIGDPIIQKMFSDAIAKEARDMGLYTSITDNGAGGLSSSVGEMSEQSSGCMVNLEKVPLKYPGLDPWQIWVSESQERMTLSVPQNKWLEFASLMKRRGVEATIIGTYTDSGKCVVMYNDKKALDIDLDFLHNGRPKKQQKSKVPRKSKVESQKFKHPIDLTSVLEKMLAQPNICGYEFISMQFDHTVQGTAVTPPLVGKGRVNADAAIIKPLFTSDRGVVLSNGIAPTYSDTDTYAMGAAVIDMAIAAAVSVGGNPDYMSILDNFCWSSSDKPERLYELKRAAEACYDYATIFGTPFISGKDSMFNDFNGYDSAGQPIHIAAPPTLLISAIGVVPDIKKTVTLEFKNAGDLIYILGDTFDEIGQSEYAIMTRAGGNVPHVDGEKNLSLYRALYSAIQKKYVASAISVARGGIGIAIAKSAIGGMIGCEIVLQTKLRDDIFLFSESRGRFLISINPKHKIDFEKSMGENSFMRIGTVTNNNEIKIDDNMNKNIIKLSIKKVHSSYKSTFDNY